jgi:DNA-directed RNA polymerase specialized sigma24 family protein
VLLQGVTRSRGSKAPVPWLFRSVIQTAISLLRQRLGRSKGVFASISRDSERPQARASQQRQAADAGRSCAVVCVDVELCDSSEKQQLVTADVTASVHFGYIHAAVVASNDDISITFNF